MAEEEEFAAQGGLDSHVGISFLLREFMWFALKCIVGLDMKEEDIYVIVYCFFYSFVINMHMYSVYGILI